MQRHRQIQRKIAKDSGKIEVPLKRGRRLDVTKGRKAIEIERSGGSQKIAKAIRRLKSKKALSKELRVPQKDLDKAKRIAQKERVRVIIKNISATKKRVVSK